MIKEQMLLTCELKQDVNAGPYVYESIWMMKVRDDG